MDRVRVFNRQGYGLCDLRVTVSRSAFINDEGEASFDIVFSDVNNREDFLNFGNWLLVESDKSEDWVGMIEEVDDKRFFSTVRAFTPERQFFYRDVPKQQVMSGKSGVIFRECINICNRAESTVIVAGNINAGGADIPSENMAGANLREYIYELSEKSGYEYSFSPVVQSGILTIQANWNEKVGVFSNFTLEESYNIADEPYSRKRKAPSANELWGYGNGSSQVDRPLAVYRDSEFANLYGLRQGTKYYSEYSSAGAVLNAIKSEIINTRSPKSTWKVSIVDVGSTYENVRIGNVHLVRMWSIKGGVSFNGRVLGMLNNPKNGKIELIIQEVYNDTTT